MIERVVVLLCVVVAVLVCGCGGSGSDKAGGVRSHPLVLTLADGETDASNAQSFAAAVKQLSGGTLVIAIKRRWRVSDPRYETDLIKDVEAGRAQLGISASRAFDTVGIGSLEALQAPFLIDNVALERRVLGSDVATRMLGALGQAGLVGLTILPGPLRRPMGFSKPLMSLSDYRGARIGIRPSLVTEATLRALGATPVVLRSDSSTSGLDGIEGHITQLDQGFAEHGATIAGNINFEPRPNVIFSSRRAFESLTAGQRQVLIRAAARAQATAAVWEADGASTSDLCRRGIRIVAASAGDLAELRVAVRPVYSKLESSQPTKALIDEIASIRQGLGGSPDVASCTTTAAPVRIARSGGELEGHWQVTYSEQDLKSAGADPSEDGPANYGRFLLTFDRGKWSEIGPPGGSASGTYVLKGSRITFYRHDDAYPGSDTEIWGPYMWSAYRDTLTFRKAKDFAQGPTGLVVKPWRRS